MSSTSTTKTTKTLTVVKREVFYDDSFFKDCWNDYDSAVKNVLKNFETDTNQKQIDLANRNNCTDVYRQIRSNNIESDLYKSQALQITEHEGNFQCVMDVKDFDPNELQVKVVENRVCVDGKFEKKSADGMSMSSKSFHKEFTLPSSANIEQISTALSRDGVLTIKAPKKDSSITNAQPAETKTLTDSSQTSSVQQTSSKTATSEVNSVSQQTKTTSKSTFSSTKTVSMSSNSSVDIGNDLPANIQDRLVFSHDNVNMKLPEPK